MRLNFGVWISRAECIATGGLRPPLLVARCRAGAPNAEAVTKNSGQPWNPSVADCRIDPPTETGVFACCPDSGIGASLIGEWILLPPVAIVRLLPRLWNRNLVDWGMERPTASRIVRLLPRLWNPGLVDWRMEPPTADRGVRLLPRLWNRSVADCRIDPPTARPECSLTAQTLESERH
jgi:hypothetical protein